MRKRFVYIILFFMMASFTGCGGNQEEETAPKIKARQGEIGEALGTLAVTTSSTEAGTSAEESSKETSINILIPEEMLPLSEEQEEISTEKSENPNSDEKILMNQAKQKISILRSLKKS